MKEIKLSDYESIVGRKAIDELRFLATPLAKKKLKFMNSALWRGGISEILARLAPLFSELGLIASWELMKGNREFFAACRVFQGALLGEKAEIKDEMFSTFLSVAQQNAKNIKFEDGFSMLFDHLPLGLTKYKDKSKGAKWIWRCGNDISRPNDKVWKFFYELLKRFDASIFSLPTFTDHLPMPKYLIYPCIDPLGEKNRELPFGVVSRVLNQYGIDSSRPIITQISKFERLKDHLGVIEAYRLVKRSANCQLVIAGGGDLDNPEVDAVLQSVKEEAVSDPDIHVIVLPPLSDIEINALQSSATVILQKSLREGFGLTVTEALWKGKPVIASPVGGIPVQIKNDVTGILVNSVEAAAYQLKRLLDDKDAIETLGKNGKEYVRLNFLLPKLMKNYLLLFLALENS